MHMYCGGKPQHHICNVTLHPGIYTVKPFLKDTPNIGRHIFNLSIKDKLCVPWLQDHGNTILATVPLNYNFTHARRSTRGTTQPFACAWTAKICRGSQNFHVTWRVNLHETGRATPRNVLVLHAHACYYSTRVVLHA